MGKKCKNCNNDNKSCSGKKQIDEILSYIKLNIAGYTVKYPRSYHPEIVHLETIPNIKDLKDNTDNEETSKLNLIKKQEQMERVMDTLRKLPVDKRKTVFSDIGFSSTPLNNKTELDREVLSNRLREILLHIYKSSPSDIKIQSKPLGDETCTDQVKYQKENTFNIILPNGEIIKVINLSYKHKETPNRSEKATNETRLHSHGLTELEMKEINMSANMVEAELTKCVETIFNKYIGEDGLLDLRGEKEYSVFMKSVPCLSRYGLGLRVLVSNNGKGDPRIEFVVSPINPSKNKDMKCSKSTKPKCRKKVKSIIEEFVWICNNKKDLSYKANSIIKLANVKCVFYVNARYGCEYKSTVVDKSKVNTDKSTVIDKHTKLVSICTCQDNTNNGN